MRASSRRTPVFKKPRRSGAQRPSTDQAPPMLRRLRRRQPSRAASANFMRVGNVHAGPQGQFRNRLKTQVHKCSSKPRLRIRRLSIRSLTPTGPHRTIRGLPRFVQQEESLHAMTRTTFAAVMLCAVIGTAAQLRAQSPAPAPAATQTGAVHVRARHAGTERRGGVGGKKRAA